MKPSERSTHEHEPSGELAIVVISARGMLRKPLESGTAVVVGRDPGCDVVIDDESVSRRHARLVIGDPMRIEDLGSRNGTRVLGRRLTKGEPVALPVGSVAELGATTVVVLRGSSSLRDGTLVPATGASAVAGGPAIADPAMQQIDALLDLVAPSMLSVLLLGETGTGKEIFAERIHARSKRADRPFLAINCAALQETLLESELFGHEKGAFTGATASKMGLFESADGGTIFLDEIGDMVLSAQAKVLRVLQSGEFTRVGGEQTLKVDVRTLAATNRDLQAAVAAGEFREDLYFRLNVVPLRAPPLRERADDVPLLSAAFIELACRENGMKVKIISDEAVALLSAYPWPGNVRELRNVIERLVILSEESIGVDDLPEEIVAEVARHRRESAMPPTQLPRVELPAEARALPLREFRDHMEREYIRIKLDENGWNISRTASLLGIERTNLHKKMRALGLSRDNQGQPVP